MKVTIRSINRERRLHNELEEHFSPHAVNCRRALLFLTTISLGVARATTNQTIQDGGTGWSKGGGTWYADVCPSLCGYIGGFRHTWNSYSTTGAWGKWQTASYSSSVCEIYAWVPAYSVGYRTHGARYSSTSPSDSRIVDQDLYYTQAAFLINRSVTGSCNTSYLYLPDYTYETAGTKVIYYDEAMFIY